MTDVDIVVRLPEELVERARAQGVLSDARIAKLLQAELTRIEAWNTLNHTLEPAQAAFRADHPDLSEDEIMALLDDLVHEVREETDHS